MMNNKVIYIIGFMGSGKSTAGNKLASLLGWTFIDLDKYIEKISGDTISGIFSKLGEAHFRKIEAKILRNLNSGTNTVISTGGGTPCYHNNMDYMIETGLTVYLKLSPAQLKNRLSKSKGKRPLILGLKDDKLLDFIVEKLASREKWYNRAEIIIDGPELDKNLLYSLVKSKLN
jgi:shikimate kinase